MSAITTAYVSRDAEVVRAWTDAGDAINTYVQQTQRVLDAYGLARYQCYRDQGGWKPGRFRGLAIPQDEFPPDGWRMDGGYEQMAVPDKRTKAGKQVTAALDAVEHPGDPLFKLVGMPPDVEGGTGFVSPAIRLLENRTALYVGWTVNPEGRQSFFSNDATVDLERWESVPLSAYYLAIEQAEAAKAVSA
jgi:hypothetical protein